MPAKAEHSASLFGADSSFGADLAIDLDFDVSSNTVADAGGEYPVNDFIQSMRCIFSQRINSAGKRHSLLFCFPRIGRRQWPQIISKFPCV